MKGGEGRAGKTNDVPFFFSADLATLDVYVYTLYTWCFTIKIVLSMSEESQHCKPRPTVVCSGAARI